MKISFFGSSLVSSYWNGAATYYRGLLKNLAALGHDITFYEPDAYSRQQNRDIADPPWARVVVYPATEDGWRRALEEGARDADLLVKASGVGVFDGELEGALIDAARPDTICAYWDVDAPATLDSMTADPSQPLRAQVPRFDFVFTYGGGEPVVSAYTARGARRCIPIYNAVDPDTHHPAPARPDWEQDLGFLGNRLPDREARVEEFFMRAATLLPNRRFLLGGSGWESKELPGNVQHLGHVGTGDHNSFFCSPLATLNINRESMARYGFSPPTRVFEAVGAGACLLTDEWVGIDLFLEPGTEVLVAADGAAIAEHLAGLDEQRARTIAERAKARILAHHTYRQRALQVTDVLAGLERRAGVAA